MSHAAVERMMEVLCGWRPSVYSHRVVSEKAFRSAAKQWHPDKANARGVLDAMATMIMHKINAANEFQSDPVAKAQSDRRMLRRTVPSGDRRSIESASAPLSPRSSMYEKRSR